MKTVEEQSAAKREKARRSYLRNRDGRLARRKANYALVKDEKNAQRRQAYADDPCDRRGKQAAWLASSAGQEWYLRFKTSGKYQANQRKYWAKPEAKAKAKVKHQRYIIERDWLKRLADNHRIKKYGLKRGEFESMLAARGGRCDICRLVIESRACLDHCHSTGKVRGVLCNTCNAALGGFKDSAELLVAAIAYLENHRETECA